MLYLIGLGLDADGISKYGLSIIKKCKRVYLENYTVDFPYNIEELEHIIDKKVIPADRTFVESLKIVDEAKKMDIALLVYGSPLTATTHISLIQEAQKCGVRYKVVHNASILDAVSETGLQLYKFGKITSMPNFEADSFMEIVAQNKSIDAHSLILIDIELEFKKAIEKLEKISEEKNVKVSRIVVCSKLGADGKRILYGQIKNLKDEDVRAPFCFIIPGKLHFLEKEMLEGFQR